MPAPRRTLDPELSSWARSAFRPTRVEIAPAALRERERRALTRAIESSRNLNVAAGDLGVSRKTLFNRMKEYGLPPGRSGRPREAVPHAKGGDAVIVVAGVAAIVGGFLVGRWWMKRRGAQKPVVVGERGLDLFGVY